MSGKLVRRESDTKITGVCGAIGRYFGIDPTVIRILFCSCYLPWMGLHYPYLYNIINSHSK